MSRIAFVSDAHIRHSDDPQAKDLLAWIDSMSVDRICFLGDIFDVYWDYKKTHSSQKAFIDELGRRLHGGLSFDFLPGNRDFSAVDFFQRQGARVADVLSYNLGGRHVLVAHGDQSDRRMGYRLTRSVLRSLPFKWFMMSLGCDLGYRFLHRIAGASREHMSQDNLIIQQQREWSNDHLKKNVDVVLLGHSHRLERVHFKDGDLILTGNWQHHRNYILWDGEAFQLCSF